ncbi:MAG: helix-turn-helix domain-containing protein [Tepidibacter sp.]|jgi:DNA-binding transcriptional ArsR family regulator|uniref:ArsR/SmtB family transcription factor n=1 Tax=Tepidibacter sp. TaxID=2529387 RepID=UPI0025F28279|nr:helix-turn-helix domain-containing protein [Tepidibacter sp.]MCT4508743.1 helix-turn-helix domain-containing protein [Tepidibacter sp.]
MKDILVLRDIEQIKAVSHPYRVDILEAFAEEPLSAKQLSELLSEPHAKVNYHIKILLNAGILELVEEKVKSGIIEKYYLPKAKMVIMDKSILNSAVYDENVARTLNQVSISLFEKISDDFYRAAENDEVKSKHVRHYNQYYLTEEECKEVMDSLEKKITEILKGKDKKGRENTRPYNITLMGVPDLRKEKKAKK